MSDEVKDVLWVKELTTNKLTGGYDADESADIMNVGTPGVGFDIIKKNKDDTDGEFLGICGEEGGEATAAGKNGGAVEFFGGCGSDAAVGSGGNGGEGGDVLIMPGLGGAEDGIGNAGLNGSVILNYDDGDIGKGVRISGEDGDDSADLWIHNTGSIALKEVTTPTATPDYGKIYCKADNKLYFQDGAGTEHEIAFV